MKFVSYTKLLFPAVLLWFIHTAGHSQCPTIEAILVDACGTESVNEFVIINSGGGFMVEDLQLDFDMNNNIVGPPNNDININASPCGLQAGNPMVIAGCSNVIPVGPGTFIPPNSYVVLQTSAGSAAVYDFSGVCGTQQCIFVISNTCFRSAGAFSNGGSGTRTTVLSFSNNSCSEAYVYDRSLVSGNNGDYFIPPATYGNAGCVAPPVSFGNLPPQIDPMPDVTICANSYVLPPITGTNLSGGQAYYTGPNGTGTSFAPGATVTASGTYYLYDGAGSCSDEESFVLTLQTPVTPSISGIPSTICAADAPVALPTTQSGIMGEWSGTGVNGNSFDPSGLSGNIVLTFTPDAGECANTNIFIINVTMAVTPVISGVPASICEDAAAIALPATQGGINGTWSGIGVNGNQFDPSGLSGNITLTFTPDPGACATTNTATIVVTPLLIPTLSGVPATICEASSPIALPTTQSGITGNWSGAGVSGNSFDPSSQNGNITLTFTPNPGQCAGTNTTTISVTPLTTPTLSGLPASICSDEAPIALPTTQSGITGNWSGTGVSGNSFDPSGQNGNITLTFTPNPGQCAGPNTTTISVTPLITPAISGVPASLCDNEAPVTLPATQSGIAGNWSGTGVSGNSFDPNGQSGNITLTFTPDPGQCAEPNTAVISVTTAVTPTIAGVPATVCQNDAPINLPNTQSGVNGNWSGVGVSGNNFNPNGLSGNITLTFTPMAGVCANAVTANILVEPAITPTLSGVPASICQNAGAISLSNVQQGIAGSWTGPGVSGSTFNPAGLGGVITLFFTPNTGQCANANSAQVEIFMAPTIIGLEEICDLITQTYTVSFTIVGGVPGTYTVDGVPSGSVFTSGPIASGVPYSFGVNDVNDCGPFTVSGVRSCDCPTFAGTMNFDNTPVFVCENDGFNVEHNGDEVLSANDVLVFILHDNSGATIGNVITTSASTNFTYPPGVVFGQPYYVSPVAGLNDGNGNIDFSDPCVSVSQGVPVFFFPHVFETLDPTLCPGESVVVNGTTYNEANPTGAETFTGGSFNGCDSTVTIGLSFFPEATGSLMQELCTGGSITVNGTVYDENNPNGTELFPGASVNGCDSTLSIALTFVSEVFETLDPTLCPGESVVVNGTTYNEANPTGAETFTGGSFNGCDSTVTIDLSFFPEATGSLMQELCTGESITVNGTVYDENNPNGTEFFPGASVNGCDSTLAIALTFASEVFETLDPTLCPGESVVVNGTTYNEANPSGTETFTGGSFNGCDSTVTIDLSFFPEATGSLMQELCTGESITVNGTVYNENNPNGTELFPGASVNGCDSTLAIALTFVSEAFETLDPTLCPGESVVVNGTTYNEANPTGAETFVGGSFNGCDSTVTIDLSFFPEATGSLMQQLCTGESITVNGTVYDENNPNGTELFPGASVNGCDSTLSIALTFVSEAFETLDPTLCPGESVVVNGTTYNEANPSGAETFVGGSFNGCDSTVTIDLSFFPEAVNFYDPTLPVGGSVVINGTIYDSNNPSGVEIIPGASVNGCDSTVFVMLNFEELLEATFELSQPTCNSDSDGQLMVTQIDGGVPPYEIRLNGGIATVVDVLPFNFSGLASGNYELLITDASGVSASWTLFLDQPQPVLVQLASEIVVQLGDDVNFLAQANVPIAVWQWLPAFNLSCADCPNPTLVQASENSSYEVIAIDSSGCIGRAQTRVRVEISRELYIPNIFSPNDDGFNDVFGIFAGNQVAQVHAFRVFSRWGELMHEALEFQPDGNSGNAGSWDGRFRGQRMNPGVYVWYADIEFVDGRREVRSGDITLIR